MNPFKILIVDDEQPMREQLARWLKDEGYKTEQAATGRMALNMASKDNFQAILLDLILPDLDGFDVLEKLHQREPNICIIILTGHAEDDTSARAMRAGAFDFFEKPIDFPSLRQRIETAVNQFRLERNNYYELEEVKRQYQFEDIVAQSEAMRRVFSLIHRVAETEESILLVGESGTGKNLVAVAIHDSSRRRHETMIKADCAGLPENMAESELFGHVKGAFTGAIANRIGKFELANGSTLFLDEIGDLSSHLQLKFLRFLQEKIFERVGDNRLRKVEVRIIAATNKILQKEVEAGRFRHDLFFRLNQIVIEIPPLRERHGDIPLLAEHFIKKCNRKNGKTIRGISRQALELLEHYHFPGNVRELENLITFAVLMENSADIQPETIQSRLVNAQASAAPDHSHLPYKEAKENFERQYFSQLLQRFRNNVSKTAEFAGMDRSHVTTKLKALGLRPPEA